MTIWTILDIIRWTTDYFSQRKIENARLNAELIVSEVLKLKRLELYLRHDQPLTIEEREEIKRMLLRRANHEPLQYIFGEAEFYGRKFKVNRQVLIPRLETELLIEKILKELPEQSRVLDLGTGSGIIAVTLKKEKAALQVTAGDISPEALSVAQENAKLHDVQIDFRHSDLFAHIDGKFDYIVSNPPYITKEEYLHLASEVKNYEPQVALLAEEDGLIYYRKILETAKNYLAESGKIFFEIGAFQGDKVRMLAEENGYDKCEVFKDYNNYDRMVKIEL